MTTASNVKITRVGRFLARLRKALEAQALSASRRGLIEALEAKSDGELSALGLKRKDIPQYVFRDLFYA